MFLSRGRQLGSDDCLLPPPAAPRPFRFDGSLDLAAARVAMSRTQPAMLTPPQEPAREIRQLYVDAIAAAEQIIYIENQYFSSQAVYTALQQRLQVPQRSRLTIVMILPKRAEALTEDLALGFAQAKLLRALHETARRTGHKLGVYYTATRGADGREKPTYIHSKLLLVDDCFLSVGSANTTNRSMGFDTELNVSWEASAAREDALRQSIRRVRVSLLAEHCGLPESAAAAELSQTTGLVEYLDRLCEVGACRLRRHPMDTLFDEVPLLRLLKPEDFVLDPEHSLFEGMLHGVSASSSFSPVPSSLLPLHNLTANEQRVSAAQAARPPEGTPYGSAALYEKGCWWFWSFVAVVITLLGALFWSDFNASFAGKATANGYGLAPPFSSPPPCAGCNDRPRLGVRSHTRGVNRYAIPH